MRAECPAGRGPHASAAEGLVVPGNERQQRIQFNLRSSSSINLLDDDDEAQSAFSELFPVSGRGTLSTLRILTVC